MNIIEKLGITPAPWFLIGENAVYRRPQSDLYEYGGGVAGDKPVANTSKGFYGDKLTGYPEKNNARLIAAAPEMLEALIELAIDAINDKYNEIHPRYSRHRTDAWILRHAQDFFETDIKIIEKATGKTWEEIKELIK